MVVGGKKKGKRGRRNWERYFQHNFKAKRDDGLRKNMSEGEGGWNSKEEKIRKEDRWHRGRGSRCDVIEAVPPTAASSL